MLSTWEDTIQAMGNGIYVMEVWLFIFLYFPSFANPQYFNFSGILISYLLRVNISVAAQDMRDELHWTESQKGFVLSSFYWGYAVGQIPASRVAQRYGAKWTFGLRYYSFYVLINHD